MRGIPIRLFMWPYQTHFRTDVETLVNEVLRELGIPEAGAECLLVGARRPDHQNPNDVCVDPEDEKWPLKLFDELLDSVEREIRTHPMQNVAFGDEPSMRDKPENIRRDSVRLAVEKALHTFDQENDVYSFAGPPAPLGDYHVVPVLQLSRALVRRFRPLREAPSFVRFRGHKSLIHAAVTSTLGEAYDELFRHDPGRFFGQRFCSPEEVARRAASLFMRTPGIAMQDRHFGDGLFSRLNSISSLMYEGSQGQGRVILATPSDTFIEMSVRFEEPVPLREERWSRKLLQLASAETSLIADYEKLFGLGRIIKDPESGVDRDVFEVEFLGRHSWRLVCGEDVMLISHNGRPSLPRERYPSHSVLDTYRRLFSDTTDQDVTRFRVLLDTALGQQHGSLLVVAEDAESEANRLRVQGTKIEPTPLTTHLYRHVSRIDGAILMDPRGTCYAVGVILDGPARSDEAPSRGSRYNSGMRYIHAAGTRRLAVVISDDHTVDVIPVLRPRIARSAIKTAISELESALPDNYRPSLLWLSRHRFYINQGQCDRINAVLARIDAEPREVGEIRPSWQKFVPNPDMNASYFDDGSRETS